MRAFALLLLLAAPLCHAQFLGHRGGGSGGGSGPAPNSPAAVDYTLQNNNLCSSSQLGSNFYWEVGTASQILLARTQYVTLPTPALTYNATTATPIASGTKPFAAAFIAQKRGRTGSTVNFTSADINALHFLDGQVNAPENCSGATNSTILACSLQTGSNNPVNCTNTSSGFPSLSAGAICDTNNNVFSYNGEHFAAALLLGAGGGGASGPGGYGAYTPSQFTTDMQTTLSLPGCQLYFEGLVAGGIETTPTCIRTFLQNILSNTLVYHDAIGTNEVVTNYAGNSSIASRNAGYPCEQPGVYKAYINNTGGCNGASVPAQVLNNITASPTTITSSTTLSNGNANGTNWIQAGVSQANGASPIPENVKYSMGIWHLSDPLAGDGAFCGIGSLGTSLCIDQTFTYYSLIVMKASAGSGYNGEQCDRLLRQAWITGHNQTGTVPNP